MESSSQPSSNQFHQIKLEPDEKIIAVIRRHVFGLLGIYILAISAFIALLLLAGAVGIDLIRGLSGEASLMLGGITFLLLLMMVLMLFAVTSSYRQTELLLTTKGIIQVLQHGLFNRKVSRLSMSDIEDVTTEQKGLMQTLFNYGTLHVETSGELKNFAFKYTPNPNKYANQIIDLRHGKSQEGYD